MASQPIGGITLQETCKLNRRETGKKQEEWPEDKKKFFKKKKIREGRQS